MKTNRKPPGKVWKIFAWACFFLGIVTAMTLHLVFLALGHFMDTARLAALEDKVMSFLAECYVSRFGDFP